MMLTGATTDISVDPIGHGSYSSVHTGIYQGNRVALKILRVSNSNAASDEFQVYTVVHIHPTNLINFLCRCLQEKH